MSQHKFASITASLLARKGEARPWTDPAPNHGDGEKKPLSWRPEFHHRMDAPPVIAPRPAPAPQVAPPPPVIAKEKSCSVRMSRHDFERLGIVAVKTGSSRQQLLKDALAQFLTAQAQHFSCACLGVCENGCGDAGGAP